MINLFLEEINNKKNNDELYTKILKIFLEVSKYYEIEKKTFVSFLNILCDVANKNVIDAELNAKHIYNELKEINIYYGFEDFDFTKINNKNICNYLLEKIEIYEKTLSSDIDILPDGDIYNDDGYFAFIVSYFVVLKNKSKGHF
jgi:hypothetical protein